VLVGVLGQLGADACLLDRILAAGVRACVAPAADRLGVLVGPALDELCGVAPTGRLCEPRNFFSYSEDGGSRDNKLQRFVALRPGQTLTAGTCGVPGWSGVGDTFLWRPVAMIRRAPALSPSRGEPQVSLRLGEQEA
jgi:hypothetical protein